MHDSKLLKIIRLLREPELKRLAKFLKSPFYNANPHITNCYYYLRKYFPAFDSSNLRKEKVFKKLFPSRNYEHQKMLNLMSDFTALAEQFLGLLQLEKEDFEKEKLLLRAFAERGEAYGAFTKKCQELHSRLEASPYRDATYFQEKFFLEQLYFNHPGTDKFKLTGAQYDHSMSHLEQYFVLEKLLLTCEMKARESPLSEKHDIVKMEKMFFGRNNDFLTNPIANAYAEMLYLLDSGEEDNYFKLKAIFQNNLPAYPKRQQQNILTCLLNFVIKKGNTGSRLYVKESLLLYKIGLREKLFLQEEKLNDRIYTNIALLAAKLKEYDWCTEFIITYENSLEERIREDAKTYCLAYLHYGQQNDQAAMEHLHSIKFVNDFYQLGARVLLLRIYFEAFLKGANLYDLLFAQSKSLEKYLRRNSNISEQKQASHLNFVLALRQLIKWIVEPDKREAQKEKFRLEIQQKKMAYKTWLLKQLEEAL